MFCKGPTTYRNFRISNTKFYNLFDAQLSPWRIAHIFWKTHIRGISHIFYDTAIQGILYILWETAHQEDSPYLLTQHLRGQLIFSVKRQHRGNSPYFWEKATRDSPYFLGNSNLGMAHIFWEKAIQGQPIFSGKQQLRDSPYFLENSTLGGIANIFWETAA